RDRTVTGVQTCALPIYLELPVKTRTLPARTRNPLAAPLLALPLLLLAGCSTATTPTTPAPTPAADIGHVHGMSVDLASTKILLRAAERRAGSEQRPRQT